MLRFGFLRGLFAAIFGAAASTQAAAQGDADEIAALAALRPGMPAAEAEAAMGPLWRAPAPHKGGVVDVLENSHGFRLRLDRDGASGSVAFDWRFRGAVDRLRMGMSIAEARKAAPDLLIGEDRPLMRGVRDGLRDLPGGARMSVKFTLEKVNGVRLWAPGAEYDEPFAPPYPGPAGAPGAPFADANLKLVVLDGLLYGRALDLGRPEDLAAHVLGREVDMEEEGYDPIPEARDYLLRYPLDQALLDQVETLIFDGGNDIYRYIWYFWSGEDEGFDVSSLDGIALCRNLKFIQVISMIETFDIGRLEGLDRLEELSISSGFTNPEALRALPALNRLRIIDTRTYEEATTPGHPTRRLLDELKARGVSLHVAPGVWRGERPAPFN
ncbi:MAG: DUF6892 domain-containing protein [Pikeienuella sp.]